MEELEDFRKLVERLPKVEDVDKMKNFLESNIREFRSDNDIFKHEFEKQCMIIRRYDEVLAQKCSKISLQQLRQDALCQLNEKFDRTMSHIDEERNLLRTDIDRVDTFSKGLEYAVNVGIEKKFQREKLKMGIASQNADSLAPESGANLKKVLIMKADKIDIEKLYDIKSDKIETDNMMNVLQIFSK